MSLVAIPHPLGDLEPPLELQARQAAEMGETGAARLPDGSWWKPVDLTTVTRVEVHVEPLDADDRAPTLTRDAIVYDPANGKLRLVWQAGDPIDFLGLYRVWTRIIWPGTRPQTAPGTPDASVTLRVFSQRQR